MFQAAAPLMDKITSPSILVMVAKAKEAEKNYREAEKAYERANDFENIIRLNLDFLDNPNQQSCSTKMVAHFYQLLTKHIRVNEHQSVVEFERNSELAVFNVFECV